MAAAPPAPRGPPAAAPQPAVDAGAAGTAYTAASLRQLQNRLIGSRTRKAELVARGEVPAIVGVLALAPTEESLSLVALAATILSSLAHACPRPALLALLRAALPAALLHALAALAPPLSQAAAHALEALLRALKALSGALRTLLLPGPRAHATPLALSARTPALPPVPADSLFPLARAAVQLLFADASLPLWLAPLLAAPPLPTRAMPASNASRIFVRPGSATAGPSTPRSSSPVRTGPSVPTTSLPPPLRLADLVFAILGNCIGIPSQSAPDAVAQARQDADAASEIAQRKARVLRFRPAVAQGVADSLEEPGMRTRSAAGAPLGSSRLAHELVDADGDVGMQPTSSSAAPPPQARVVQRGTSAERERDHERGRGARTRSEEESRARAGVLRVLLEGAECGFEKTQEAALWALAELVREDIGTTQRLVTCPTPSGHLPTAMLLNLAKEPSAPVRLAAMSCLVNFLKVHPFSAKTHECVLSVIIELTDEVGEVQIAATFTLARLVADDAELQMLAAEQYDAVRRLGALLHKTRTAVASQDSKAEGRPSDDGVIRLREATLTALAALAFQRDEIRRAIVDATSPALLPLIVPSLTASDLGIRVAACRLVRALSRSISILRTSLVDVGVADQLIRILKDDAEDAEVKQEATATICNLVLKFAPMKQLLVEGGGVAKLIELAQSAASGGMRLNALWALKNILWSSETETKRALLDTLGWDYVAELALDAAGSDEAAQEQALSIMRNVASSREADIDLTLRGFGSQRLLDLLEAVVWQKRGSAITEQAAYVLVNLATGSESHRRSIIDRPNLIEALLYFLTHKTAEIRLASVWAALNLTIRTSRTSTSDIAADALARLRAFEYHTHLRPLADDPERDVADRAKSLLALFDESSSATG